MPRRVDNDTARCGTSARWKATCQLSGFEGYSDEFVTDPYGRKVLRRFADEPHPLDNPPKIKAEQTPPWVSPEQVPVFVELGDITAEDL